MNMKTNWNHHPDEACFEVPTFLSRFDFMIIIEDLLQGRPLPAISRVITHMSKVSTLVTSIYN